jgi:hypothetical protein
MTESEWLECTDPSRMLSFLQDRISARKSRLFASACGYEIRVHMPDPRCVKAIEAAERFADGLATGEELNGARDWAKDVVKECTHEARYISATGSREAIADAAASTAAGGVAKNVVRASAWDAARGVVAPFAEVLASQAECEACTRGASPTEITRNIEEARAIGIAFQISILRDIVGNPFRTATITSPWRTPTVADLATAAYGERVRNNGRLDSDRLAVLSDALEEAGCDDEAILGHLRGPGPHARGCWVLDLILGKT